MDFIERLFHIAPDGGSGMLETAILFAVLSIPLVLTVLRKTRKRQAAARFLPLH